MQTFVTLLRGINVSGHHIIKMDALRSLLQELEFQDIHTYIQSGNVVLKSKNKDTIALQQSIAQAIEKQFGFQISVHMLTKEHFNQILDANPFIQDPEKDPSFMHVMFLDQEPSTLRLEQIEAKQRHGEEISIHTNAVYLYLPKGSGDSKWSNTFLENQLKVTATTRNWRTCQKLKELCQNN
jgi:uncharacterized protein (DUF1697 family)